MMKKLIIVSLLWILIGRVPAYAGEANKIAAIVGDGVISTFDVRDRALMIVNSASDAGIASDAVVDSALPQALQTLIDEKLYQQEAERLHITVTTAELNYAIVGIEGKNNLQAGGFSRFLEERNIPVSTVKEQIRSQIRLVKIINNQIRPNITLTDKELELEITRLGGNNRSLSLKQIFVSFTDSDNGTKSKLKKQLEYVQKTAEGCDSFDKIANAENALLAPTTLNVSMASLNPAIRDVVNDLKIEKPSAILQTADSMQLLMVCSRSEPVITAEEKKRLSDILTQRKVEIQTSQYMRDLRQSTYVEIRM